MLNRKLARLAKTFAMTRLKLTTALGFLLCGCSGDPASDLAPAEQRAAPTAPDTGKVDPATVGTSPGAYTNQRDVLVPGRLLVDVVDIDVPPRILELTQRLLHAIRENPDLWTRLANQAGPGEPLPYDPALGLSEAEYELLLVSDHQTRTRKYADATLVITEDESDVLRLDGEELLPELTGIEIDLDENVVRTPFGLLTQRTEVDAPKESIHGAWKGTQWRHQSGTLYEFTDVRFAVGRLGKDGRCLLYYEVKRFDGIEKTRISRTLYFDSPGEE